MSTKHLLAIVILAFLAACGQAKSDADPTATPASPAAVPPVTPDAASPIPAYDPAKLITTPSGLQYVILAEGEGDRPTTGDTVSVHYTGWLSDGSQFDSSRDRGEPYTFQLGVGDVIAGWDEGIALLQPGAKALLIIPPDLGYGDVARGPLPANSTLTFEVELVTVVGPPEGLGPDDPVQIPLAFNADDVITTDSGLQYVILQAGSGPAPQPGDNVSVHYTGWLKNGDQFDSSADRDPIRFLLGSGRVIQGWDEGLALLNEGAKALFIIPPNLGYGAAGQGNIPANATLYFQVELVKVEPAPTPVAVAAADFTTTESGLKYYDIKVGDGDDTNGATALEIHYTAWVEGGNKFDSSYDRDLPFRFQPNQGMVFPGLEEGVQSMRVGGIRQLVIPPDLAFGEQGRPPVIPPNATLIFEIELLTADKGQ